MSDIAEDIERISSELVDAFVKEGEHDAQRDWVKLTLSVARAINSERERCAAMAEFTGKAYTLNPFSKIDKEIGQIISNAMAEASFIVRDLIRRGRAS